MSGIKVFNPTGSAPNRILNIVCKEILDEENSKDTNTTCNDLHHPSVEPTPALVQVPIDDFITSNVRRSPQDPPNRTGLDIYEQSDYEDDDYEDDDIPRMPKGWNTGFDKTEDMDCNDNPFTTSCPAIIGSQPTKNKSPQRFNDDEIMIDEPSTSAANKNGKPDILERDTLRQEPIEKRKAVKTGDNPSQKKQREIQQNDFERNMIGDGNCFFR